MNIARARQLQITGPDRKTCYGGDQLWFSSNTKAAGGCGSVAGANALRSLALTNREFRKAVLSSKKLPPQLKDALCSYKPDHENFPLLMTGVYETMGSMEVFPLNLIYDRKDRSSGFFSKVKSTFGLTNIGYIVGIIRFCRKFSIDISARYLNAAFLSKEEARQFIKEGLKKSGAVVLLTCLNRHNIRMFSGDADLNSKLIDGKDTPVKSHFVTITDIDTDRLLVTTWGKPGVIDLNELAGSWQSIKAYEASLIYIEPSTKKEANNAMLGAFRLFAAGIGHALTRHGAVLKKES